MFEIAFLVALALIAAVAVAVVVMRFLYVAIGNLIDWLILTFGNPDGVREVKRRRGLGP